MISLEKFGQNLKSKYPDGVAADGRRYAEIPDTEIARKYIANNPQYKGKVDETASFTERVGADWTKRAETIGANKDNVDPDSLGDVANKTLQNFGEVAGGVSDVGIEGAKSLDRKITGGAIERGVESTMKAVGQNPIVQKVAGAVGGLAEKYPETAKDVEAVANIAALAPIGKGLGLVKDAAKAGAKASGIDAIPSKVAGKVTDVVAKPRLPSVDTVLKQTPRTKFDEYASIAKKAVEDNKNTTPLEHVGMRAQTALDQVQRKLDTIGANKSAIMESASGRVPVGNIAVKFRQDLANALKSKTAVEGDTRLLKNIEKEATKLGANPSAAQVDKFVDFVQDSVYTARRDLTVPVTDGTTAMVRQLTGRLNEALKAKLPTGYRTLNQKYADMIDLRNELNLKLGVEGEKGGALMKRVFSPSDAGTKELFAKILKETGIDLTNEATLAKYMMETLGDARQRSMLEALGIQISKPTPSGVFMTGVNKVIDAANSPERQLTRARGLTLDDSLK